MSVCILFPAILWLSSSPTTIQTTTLKVRTYFNMQSQFDFTRPHCEQLEVRIYEGVLKIYYLEPELEDLVLGQLEVLPCGSFAVFSPRVPFVFYKSFPLANGNILPEFNDGEL